MPLEKFQGIDNVPESCVEETKFTHTVHTPANDSFQISPTPIKEDEMRVVSRTSSLDLPAEIKYLKVQFIEFYTKPSVAQSKINSKIFHMKIEIDNVLRTVQMGLDQIDLLDPINSMIYSIDREFGKDCKFQKHNDYYRGVSEFAINYSKWRS